MIRKKHWILKALIVLHITAYGRIAFAQSDFEGKVEFNITYTKVPDQMKGYESMLPSKTVTYLKDGSSRIEIPMAMGGTQVVIYNKRKAAALILMDMMGQKIAVPMNTEDLNEGKNPMDDADITYFEEYKIISGYKCQKALIKTTLEDGNTNDMVVYFTDKIQNHTQNFGDLGGLPLEYSISQNGTSSTMTATNISAETVPDELMSLEIPSGYEQQSVEDLGGN